jgi:hypothetical protein
MSLRAYDYISLLGFHSLKKTWQISWQYLKIAVKQQHQFSPAEMETGLKRTALADILSKDNRAADI